MQPFRCVSACCRVAQTFIYVFCMLCAALCRYRSPVSAWSKEKSCFRSLSHAFLCAHTPNFLRSRRALRCICCLKTMTILRTHSCCSILLHVATIIACIVFWCFVHSMCCCGLVADRRQLQSYRLGHSPDPFACCVLATITINFAHMKGCLIATTVFFCGFCACKKSGFVMFHCVIGK